MTTSKTQECALCGSTEDVATRDCRVCGKTLAALCNRCHLGLAWQALRGWLDRAKAPDGPPWLSEATVQQETRQPLRLP